MVGLGRCQPPVVWGHGWNGTGWGCGQHHINVHCVATNVLGREKKGGGGQESLATSKSGYPGPCAFLQTGPLRVPWQKEPLDGSPGMGEWQLQVVCQGTRGTRARARVCAGLRVGG